MAVGDLKENPFRDEIFDYLCGHGYIEGSIADYDYRTALDTQKLLRFLEDTQEQPLEKYRKTHGSNWRSSLVQLICKRIEIKGLLQALREQIEDYASGAKFFLAYFRSNLENMEESEARYQKNILSVYREFSYEDKKGSHRVDLAIFLNGFPIIMMELKKQTAGQKAGFEGTKQFRETRNPEELVFGFNRRTLVYITLDEFDAYIATRLDKRNTKFLPFNRGYQEGAGNPSEPGKHSTFYVWEDILQRDMIFKILREFMFIDDEGTMIFPRYHQLDSVLKAEEDVRKNGVGGRYLIWHSAGSGKTKTISWIAKRMINMPAINTVIIISDRTVIDSQLGNEISTMDGRKGVVRHIEESSQELLQAIMAGGYVIVTTLQKFPFILEHLRDLKARNYAILIDEAHSSAAGKTMSKVLETLSGKTLKEAIATDELYEELEDGQELLVKQKSRMAALTNVSYFAFTATPKTETMELFGVQSERGKEYFHKYSMKQAIEEGFILNPLACYTTYNERLEVRKKKDDDSQYESASAARIILGYITSTPEVIEAKVDIFMQDFTTRRLNWLDRKAKAMVIAPSRKHAVCYKLAIDRWIQDHACNFCSVAGFTGTIDLDGFKYTEENMNKEFKETALRDIIRNNDDARIIVVADKLQTGFDESRLCVLYVDKKLNSSVKAVQTLSRINRPHAGKKTLILDFINDVDTIIAYFKEFYGGELYLPSENETDPNILFAKRDTLLTADVFTLEQAEMVYLNIAAKNKHAGDITAVFAQNKTAYHALSSEKQKLFLAEIKKFVRLFYYISAVYNIWDEEMKHLAVYLDALYNVLYEKEEQPKLDAAELVELVMFSAEKALEEGSLLVRNEDRQMDRVSTSASFKTPIFSLLDEILEQINAKYGGYANSKEELEDIVAAVKEDEELKTTVLNKDNSVQASEDEASKRIRNLFIEHLLSSEGEQFEFYSKLSNDSQILHQLARMIVKELQSTVLAS